MAWTNLQTKDFYEQYVRKHEQQFREETIPTRRIALRQAQLREYAELEA